MDVQRNGTDDPCPTLEDGVDEELARGMVRQNVAVVSIESLMVRRRWLA